MSQGSSLNAQKAPNVASGEGLNTEQGGNRGQVVSMKVSNTPRTRTQAQISGGKQMIDNAADDQGRDMPRVSVVR